MKIYQNHVLSKEFDIGRTFREKIREETNEDNDTIDYKKIKKIESQKEFIDWIIHLSDGVYNLFIGDRLYSLNNDELVIVIRFCPHLFYDKKNNFFFNLSFIRLFDVPFKENSQEIIASVNIRGSFIDVVIPFHSIDEFFKEIKEIDYVNIKADDFEICYILSIFGKKIKKKYLKSSIFYHKYSDLLMHHKYSAIAIAATSLFGFIPFMPNPFFNFELEDIIFFYSGFIILEGLLLFHRSDVIKKMKNLK